MTHNTAIYARTSPNCALSAEVQVEQLTEVANKRGWTVVCTLTDRPTSSPKGWGRRPGEVALLERVRRGDVRRVLLWDIDRFGRSLSDLVSFIEICGNAGVSLWVHREGLDTEVNSNMSLFDLAGMLAHHLKQSRRERILLGLSAARANSVRLGRPSLPASKIERAKEGLKAGEAVRQIARSAGMSAASVCRLKASMERSSVELAP